ncbi:MAG: pilus assembly protein [Acidobacteria bacterium]|nr:pilus assembly protein [Acidobacteriota bacterium]
MRNVSRKRSPAKDSRGQSLAETALLLPPLLILFLNAINFGHFLLITLNLTSATRNGLEYAISGSSTPVNQPLPQPGSLTGPTAATVNSLIAQELGSFNNGTLGVQVCSLSVPGGAGSPPATCATAGSVPASAPTPDADPESTTYPGYALNRVDIWYTFKPLIPSTPFSLAVLMIPECSLSNGTTTCTFTSHAEMRAMGS